MKVIITFTFCCDNLFYLIGNNCHSVSVSCATSVCVWMTLKYTASVSGLIYICSLQQYVCLVKENSVPDDNNCGGN